MIDSTPAQQAAVLARGNVLVEAGAGAGKTRTLVERCLAWLLDEDSPGSLDEILMVTFTEAAAAEMRRRLRLELDKLIAGPLAPGASRRLAEQSALLDRAWICTLHSFCFQLVRQHFYKLGLDPRLTLLAPERTAVYQRQALTALLDRHYRNETPEARAIQELIEAHGKDWDKLVCDLILRVHDYAQSLSDPAAWFAAQRAYFENPEPTEWRDWLMAELAGLRGKWTRALLSHAAENPAARQCAAALVKLPPQPSRQEFAETLEAICAEHDSCKPKPSKTLEAIFKEARFLRSVCAGGAVDPLVEDWNWARDPMLTLLGLAQEFGQIYGRIKQDAGGLDFQDLEQFALQLLRDRQSRQPSDIAAQWRKKVKMIFVDEYQDINGAQEAIISALGRQGAEANRFLVGDVKQSIYRFRLADPRIFSKQKETWQSGPHCQVIALSENFRSHQSILNFVNSLFGVLMRKDVGGIDYDDDARLRCGNPAARPHVSAGHAPRVELLLRRPPEATEDGEAAPAASSQRPTAALFDSLAPRSGERARERGSSLQTAVRPPLAPPSGTEIEARLIATRLSDLRQQETLVWDKDLAGTRPVKWSDMVVLLRAPRAKLEAYVKAFDDLCVPLAATRVGFYDSLEVRDLINLLTILDNPLQDVPLLGVLASPLVGLNAAELATIRLARRSGHFWLALAQWRKEAGKPGGAATPLERRLLEKVSPFLDDFRAWRRLSRLRPVSHCLERVLDETHYADWLSAQARGGQRRANVEQLLQLTRAFDSDRGEGLYRFLRFVEAQQKNDVDIEPAGLPMTDAVRIMSIHQSKGLEFPVVVLADLDKKFNLQDTQGRVILDEELGLCPQVKPPGNRRFYPSLAHWIAGRRQKRETYGEELRLLYVAATRACEHLILCGAIGKNTVSQKWQELAAIDTESSPALAAGSYLDWIGAWLAKTHSPLALLADGQSSFLRWTYCDEAALFPMAAQPVASKRSALAAASGSLAPRSGERARERGSPSNVANPAVAAIPLPIAPGSLGRIRERLQWSYPFQAATVLTAKAAVSGLRRQIALSADEESGGIFSIESAPLWRATKAKAGELSATEAGSAHHAFLELAQLDRIATTAGLKEEAARLCGQGLLTAAQAACLDFNALAAFWQSDVGRNLLSQAEYIRRELAFTAQFSCGELARMGAADFARAGDKEFVVVQGVIDLAVLLPREIWLLDFKTDSFASAQLAARVESYRPQLALYSAAAARIYRRPATRSWLHFLTAGKTVAIEAPRLKLEQMKLFES